MFLSLTVFILLLYRINRFIFSKKISLFYSLLILCTPTLINFSFLSEIQFLKIFGDNLYNFRVPRPMISNLFLLSFIYLILVIIGGSFFSTSSGLRFIKIYSLFKYSLNQILSFSRQKNIFMNKLIFTKINFDFNEINKYFLTIIIFILSLFILT